jgi:hypothetical protein
MFQYLDIIWLRDRGPVSDSRRVPLDRLQWMPNVDPFIMFLFHESVSFILRITAPSLAHEMFSESFFSSINVDQKRGTLCRSRKKYDSA